MSNWGFRGYADLSSAVFAIAGLLIARRQPRNSIGWLLVLAGLSVGFEGFVQEYVTRATLQPTGRS